MSPLTLAGLALVLAALGLHRAIVGTGRPLRTGPWPGLTALGAGLLLADALLLAGGQLVAGPPEVDASLRSALPYIPSAVLGAVVPLLLAARSTGMPGAVSAVTGAYLLPRSAVSLVFPSIALPPLLLVSAVVLDLALWLRSSDLAWLGHAWPLRRAMRLRRVVESGADGPRTLSPGRAALGCALFAVALAAIEPANSGLLGASPSLWAAETVVWAGALSAALAGAVGWALAATSLPIPGRSARPRA